MKAVYFQLSAILFLIVILVSLVFCVRKEEKEERKRYLDYQMQ